MGDKNHPQMVGLLLGLPREMYIYMSLFPDDGRVLSFFGQSQV